VLQRFRIEDTRTITEFLITLLKLSLCRFELGVLCKLQLRPEWALIMRSRRLLQPVKCSEQKHKHHMIAYIAVQKHSMLTLGVVGFGLLRVWGTEISCSCLGLISEPTISECNICGLPGPNAAFEGLSCAWVTDCCPVCPPEGPHSREFLTADWSSLQFCTGSYCWLTGSSFLIDSWFAGHCCSPALASVLMSAEKVTGQQPC
jgi:hypothetical protein